MKLNMGCGPQKLDGYVSVDRDPNCGADVVCFVDAELPFADDEVSEIRADNIWEHIGDSFISMVNEWRRISKDEALWHIRVPHVDAHGAFQDPTHVRFFCEETFDYININHNRWKSFGRHYGLPAFKVISMKKSRRFLDVVLRVVKDPSCNRLTEPEHPLRKI